MPQQPMPQPVQQPAPLPELPQQAPELPPPPAGLIPPAVIEADAAQPLVTEEETAEEPGEISLDELDLELPAYNPLMD